MTVDQIKNDVVATIAYKLTVDGEVLDEATADDPLEYLHGHENIISGLERELTGKRVGDSLTVTLGPDDAYGDYDPDDTQAIAREDLPEEIQVGMELLLEDDAGNFFEASVKKIGAAEVVLDFNPPLAGKTVTYEIAVLDIREADEDELDHGHVHSFLEDFEHE